MGSNHVHAPISADSVLSGAPRTKYPRTLCAALPRDHTEMAHQDPCATGLPGMGFEQQECRRLVLINGRGGNYVRARIVQEANVDLDHARKATAVSPRAP
jgi:hypothetical protein